MNYRVSETDVKPGRPRRRRGKKKRTKSKKIPRTTSQRTLISPSELDQTSSETDDGRWKEAKSSVRTGEEGGREGGKEGPSDGPARYGRKNEDASEEKLSTGGADRQTETGCRPETLGVSSHFAGRTRRKGRKNAVGTPAG